MDLQQTLLKKGYTKAAELLKSLTVSDHFIKDMQAILMTCLTSREKLADDIYVLCTQLMSVETFEKQYTEILVRDLTLSLIHI